MLGIYVHIPFCKQKCLYCDFNSYPNLLGMSSSYTNAVVHEIGNSYKRCEEVDTIYIGGGTPTYLDNREIKRILGVIRENFVITKTCEITIECNPGTVDEKKLNELYGCGINRLSIGCQSADDQILKRLGRVHSFSDFLECVKSARRSGFENISVDLMFGLPGQDREIWLDTLEKVTAQNPEHISAYSLKIEEGTPFFDMYNKNKLIVPSDDENREMYDMAVDFLNKSGYSRYEISNFSKKGYESRHNLKYWKRDDYIGFGCGAYSCIGDKRFANIYDIKKYVESLNSSLSAVDKETKISCTKDDMMSEYVFLGLRLDRGVSKKDFLNRFGCDIHDVFSVPLDKHLKVTKTLIETKTHIKINPDYFYVSNMIMSDFIL